MAFELIGKTATIGTECILPSTSKSHSILFLSPSSIKSLQISNCSNILVHTKEGQLILTCWSSNTIENKTAALYSNLFQHYMNSPIIIEPLKCEFFPAEKIYLSPWKNKNYHHSQEVKLFIEKELCHIYFREGLVLKLTYLGYPLQFIVKKIIPFVLKTTDEEKLDELPTAFSKLHLEDEKKNTNLNSNLFIELKASQTSTPISSDKISLKTLQTFSPVSFNKESPLTSQTSTPVSSNKSSSKSKKTRNSVKPTVEVSKPEHFYYSFAVTKIYTVLENSSKMIKFEDIAGLDKNIEFIVSAVNSILQKYGIFYLSTSGILLIGPSGSGKSMLGEALKNELNIPVHIIKFQEINSFDDRSVNKLTKVFEEASKCAVSVIFLDDLDNLFLKDEISNSFLKENFIRKITELIHDSLSYYGNVLIIAAVKNEHLLPPDFRKKGFFVKELHLTISSSERKQVFLKILQNFDHSLAENEIDEIIDLTNDFSGGDLLNLCNKAKKSILCQSSTESNECIISLCDIKKNLIPVKPALPFHIEIPNVRWHEIGGMKKVKDALVEMIDWPIRLANQYKKFRITAPQGILMYGPPGCCKTMIAKALVTESNLNFIHVKGSQLFNKYVGESEKLVSEIFKKARSSTPCVLFFDEIDSMTSARGSTSGNSNVCERVVTQLLVEIDGIEPLQGVSILAATNRPDLIDPSFLRPGRFDQRIYVPLPDRETREEIFKVKLSSLPISPDMDFPYLSELTENYSGAEISEVCQEAIKNTILENKTSTTSVITMNRLIEALDNVIPKTTENVKEFFEKYEKRNFKQ